jgi:hypothetical protein
MNALERLRNENEALRHGMKELQRAHDKTFNRQRKELAAIAH